MFKTSSCIYETNLCECFRLVEADIEDMEAIVKENNLLKQQLNQCYMKVSKTQKVIFLRSEKFCIIVHVSILSWKKKWRTSTASTRTLNKHANAARSLSMPHDFDFKAICIAFSN